MSTASAHRARSIVAVFVAASVVACRDPSKDSNERAQPAASTFVEQADRMIAEILARESIPGLEIAILDHGELTLVRGYGFADVARARAMTSTTPIGVASLSKFVTSIGVMSLAQAGLLDLDAPIAQSVHRWSFPPSAFDARGVTIRRLLSHTAGTNMLSAPGFPAARPLPRVEDVLAGRAGDRGALELVQAPGVAWSYSGGGFTLLELAVEETSGQSFDECLRARVLVPAGMNSTHFGPVPRPADEAKGYDENGKEVEALAYVGSAAAGLVTCAADMGQLLLEYQRMLAGRSSVLSVSTLQSMTTPVAKITLQVDGNVIDTGDAQMGLGHFLHVAKNGHHLVFHSGGNTGVRAYWILDLDAGNGLFVAVNSDRGGDVVVPLVKSWADSCEIDPPVLF